MPSAVTTASTVPLRAVAGSAIVVFETFGCALATLPQLKAQERIEDIRMKIYAIEVETDFGRRVVKLSTPLEVDAHGGEMPASFRSLTQLLWDVLREVASKGAALSPPRAEA